MAIETVVVHTPELGDRSYIVHDGAVAAVIDPQRDIDRIVEATERLGVRIAAVAETHIHNDYVSGGLALAIRFGAPYLVAAAESVAFDRVPVMDGMLVELGEQFQLKVLATPGHTPHHLSYLFLDAGQPVAVATGGCLLYGTTGRTDLSGDERTGDLTRAQYHSAQRLGRLDATVAVLPTHGFGSFCSGGAAVGVSASTIGAQRAENLALRSIDEHEFGSRLLADLTDYPRYYRHMAARNRAGATASDLSPSQPLDGPALGSAIEAGAWVVDLRRRDAFADGHLEGSVGVEYGASFASYLGWVIPWHTPVMLMSDEPEPLGLAQRDLTRIGIDRPAGHYLGALPHGRSVVSYPVRRFADLPDPGTDDDFLVLDVRRDDEWKAGHLAGATHLPLPDVLGQAAELPRRRLWVHCAAGYRASIAASLLHRAGHRVVLINDDLVNARL